MTSGYNKCFNNNNSFEKVFLFVGMLGCCYLTYKWVKLLKLQFSTILIVLSSIYLNMDGFTKTTNTQDMTTLHSYITVNCFWYFKERYCASTQYCIGYTHPSNSSYSPVLFYRSSLPI